MLNISNILIHNRYYVYRGFHVSAPVLVNYLVKTIGLDDDCSGRKQKSKRSCLNPDAVCRFAHGKNVSCRNVFLPKKIKKKKSKEEKEPYEEVAEAV